MTSFTSFLAATDFSVAGNHAVRRAALLAHEHGARLHILHVLNEAGCKPLRDWFLPNLNADRKAARARDALRRLAVEMSSAFDVMPSIEVAVDDPFEALMKASEQVDLVVLGRRGHGRLKGLLMGGTVERMLRICRRPVLAVRTAVQGPYRQILVPIDFSAASDEAIRVADRIRCAQRLHVFHAVHSQRAALLREADVPEHVITEARLMEEEVTIARMRRKIAKLGVDGTPFSFALAYGPPARSTLRHTHRLGADLIVAGRQGRSSLGNFLLGSVSSQVLSEATCDMLIVPRPRDVSPSRHAEAAMPRSGVRAGVDNASRARSAAAHAAAWSQGGAWIHNEARFVSRKPS